jgi:hypothetical protein
MATFPTYFSVMADIARGMSEADAIAKAARQLADAIDEEPVRRADAGCGGGTGGAV